MNIDWVEYRAEGFYCIPGDFYLDPHRAAHVGVISHAHSDHYPRGMGTVYATAATIDLAALRYGNQAGRIRNVHGYGEPFQVGPVEVEFIPSGHMLGSAQILLTYAGQRVLYTGDLSLRPNPTCAPFAYPAVPVDLMIIESTFAGKARHTDNATALRNAAEAAGTKPMLIGVYSMGKAQHVSRLATEVLPEQPVFLDYELFRFHQIYAAHGVDLGPYRPYRRQDVKALMMPHILLVPPRALSGYARDTEYHKVIASGWNTKARYHYLNGNLDISDHVDAQDIVRYINRVGPKTVWFWHGSPGLLLNYCQMQGITALEVKAKTSV